MTTILDGKALSDKILSELKCEIKENNYSPCIVVVIVGDDEASKIYVRNKNKKALELGMTSQILVMPILLLI